MRYDHQCTPWTLLKSVAARVPDCWQFLCKLWLTQTKSSRALRRQTLGLDLDVDCTSALIVSESLQFGINQCSFAQVRIPQEFPQEGQVNNMIFWSFGRVDRRRHASEVLSIFSVHILVMPGDAPREVCEPRTPTKMGDHGCNDSPPTNT